MILKRLVILSLLLMCSPAFASDPSGLIYVIYPIFLLLSVGVFSATWLFTAKLNRYLRLFLRIFSLAIFWSPTYSANFYYPAFGAFIGASSGNPWATIASAIAFTLVIEGVVLAFSWCLKRLNDNAINPEGAAHAPKPLNPETLYGSTPVAVADGESVSEKENEYDQSRVFSWHGRIGRMRFACFLSLALFVNIISLQALLFLLPLDRLLSITADGWSGTVINILFQVPVLVFSIAMAIRRLNDLNQSGWFSPLIFPPFINALFFLYLLFWPGTRGENKYGAAPGANSTGVKMVAILLPLTYAGVCLFFAYKFSTS